MGINAVNYYGQIKCPCCGEQLCYLERMRTDYEYPVFNEHRLLFNRSYRCVNCQMRMDLSTYEDKGFDIQTLIRKDEQWAENLKSGKNNLKKPEIVS